MSAPFLVACISAMLFFMGGCLQIALSVARMESYDVAVMTPEVLKAAWPLAVAAVLFILLDIRMGVDKAAVRRVDDLGVPEAPLPVRSRVAPQQENVKVSYFSVPQAEEKPQSPVQGYVNRQAPAYGDGSVTLPDPNVLMNAAAGMSAPNASTAPMPVVASSDNISVSSQQTVPIAPKPRAGEGGEVSQPTIALNRENLASTQREAKQSPAAAAPQSPNSDLSFFKV